MFRKLILVIVGLIVFEVHAQKDSVLNLLKQFQLDEIKIAHLINNRDSKYSFYVETKLKSTVENVKDEMTISKHNPNNTSKHHWELIKINDKLPNKKEITKFERQKNRLKEDQILEIESNSWRIENNNDSLIIIEFTFSKKKLPRDLKLLSKCKTHLYLNKKTKLAEYIKTVNEKEFRFKVYKIKKIEIKEELLFDHQTNLYITKLEKTKVDLKFLNQLITVDQEKRCYNYKYVE